MKFDTFADEYFVYIIFPLHGHNRGKVMNRNESPFKLDKGRVMGHQMITSTQFLHANGILHCDVKPESILLNEFYYDPRKKITTRNITLCDLGSV